MNIYDKKTNIYGILLFFGGFATLVYEVIYARAFALMVGSTIVATSLVLTSIMGGMALGSFWAGNLSEKVKRPLIFYGFSQVMVAFVAPFIPFIGSQLVPKLDFLSGQLGLWARFFLIFIITLPPCIMMGASFPFIIRGLWKNDGRFVGFLYGINTLGAALGAFIAGFFMIPHLGLNHSLFFAGGLNLLIGIFALLFAGKNQKPAIEMAMTANISLALLILYALAGFASMAYQVAWIRLFAVIIGSSTYSFTLVITVFIFGLSLGSILHRGFSNRLAEATISALASFGISLWLLLTVPIFNQLPRIFLWFYHNFSDSYQLYEASKALLATLALFPAIVLMGLMMPSFCRMAAKNNPGAEIGNIYGANTLGGIGGSTLAGLFLIPAFGLRFAILLSSSIYGFIAIYLGILSYHFRMTKLFILSALTIVALLFVFSGFSWNQHIFTRGVFYRQGDFMAEMEYERDNGLIPSLKPGLNGKNKKNRQSNILYFGEGGDNIVTVFARGNDRALAIDGKVDASSFGGDMMTQKLLAHLPLFLHPNPEELLIIGLGSGITLGTALEYPQLKRADCVEISPQVIEASRFFENFNRAYWRDKRANIIKEDARFYLRKSRDKYSVIISEPSNTWIAGMGNLFTVQHFKACAQRLKDDGLLVQWLHAYEISDELLKVVIRSLNQVFPHIHLWRSANSDILILASPKPFIPDLQRAQGLFQDPAISNSMADIGIINIYSLALMELAPGDKVIKWAGVGPVNLDDKPILEFMAPKSLFYDESADISHWEKKIDENYQLCRLPYPNGDTIFQMEWFAGQLGMSQEFRVGLLELALSDRPDAALRAADLLEGGGGFYAALYWLERYKEHISELLPFSDSMYQGEYSFVSERMQALKEKILKRSVNLFPGSGTN